VNSYEMGILKKNMFKVHVGGNKTVTLVFLVERLRELRVV